VTVGNSTSRQIIGRELDRDAVARKYTNVVCAHLSGEVTENVVTILELDGEHGIRERIDDLAVYGDRIRILSSRSFFNRGGGTSGGFGWFAVLSRLSCQKHILRSSEIDYSDLQQVVASLIRAHENGAMQIRKKKYSPERELSSGFGGGNMSSVSKNDRYRANEPAASGISCFRWL